MTNYKILSDDELAQWLEVHDHWHHVNDEITRQFIFTDFMQAFAFLTKLAMVMETQNHHARIEVLYNKVELGLNTHSENDKITTKDIKLAENIESIK